MTRTLSARFALIIAASLIFGACATSGNTGGSTEASAPVPMDEEVRTGTLPNGLRYYLRQNKKPEGRAVLKLFVDAGSVLETEEERGLAHFVEHMAFNGTAHFPKETLVDYLRSLGMRFGPEVNAYTSFDATVYGIEVPTELSGSSRKLDDRALAVLDDWTYAVSFDPEDVEAERSVILEEYRSGLGAMDRVQRKILPVLFDGSPYAQRLPIGLTRIIKTASPQTIANFYRTWYRPDNMAIVIVGDLDVATLESDLENRFSAAARTDPLSRPRFELPEPKAKKRSVVIATDPELRYSYASLYYKREPSPIGTDTRSYEDRLIEYLIRDMIDARFQDAGAKSEAPFTHAGSGSTRYGRESRFFILSAAPEPNATEATLLALLREKESVVRYGFDESEIERAKTELLSALQTAVDEKDHRESESFARELGSNFLSGEPVPTPDWELKIARELLPTIGPQRIAASLKSLFNPDDLTVVLAAPDAEASSLPTEKRILELVAEVAKGKVARPASTRVEGALLGPVTGRGSIVGEVADARTGTKTWTLSNGARVVLAPTKNRNDEITLSAVARGGESSASDADAVSASLAADMSDHSGLGRFSATELNRLLAGKRVSLSFWTGDYVRGFGGSASAKDLPTLFELLYLSFTEPRFDKDAVAAYLDGVRTTLARRGESPESVFSDAVTKVVTGGHPRFEPLTEERLKEVSIEAAERYLKSALNPGDFTFVFAGKVDADTFRPLVETYVASLPGKRTGAAWRDLGMERPAAASDTVVRKGIDPKSLVFLGWFSAIPYSERGASVAAALQEYLDIRLTENIREKRGGVYSVSVSAAHLAAPRGEQLLSIRFACDPARADELSAAVEAELHAIGKGDIDPDTFSKAVEALRKEQETNLQSDDFLAASFARFDAAYGLPPSTLYDRPALYDKLKAEDLAEMASRLEKRGRSRVTLLPEKGEM